MLEPGGSFYGAVAPADFPAAIPRFVTQRSAERVGLGPALGDAEWERHPGRFAPLPRNLPRPLAQLSPLPVPPSQSQWSLLEAKIAAVRRFGDAMVTDAA